MSEDATLPTEPLPTAALNFGRMIGPLISVTRLGDFLDFGQVFKAFGNNYFAQLSHIEIIFGQLL